MSNIVTFIPYLLLLEWPNQLECEWAVHVERMENRLSLLKFFAVSHSTSKQEMERA